MTPSYKEQIKDLKYYLSSQEMVIEELKKERESAVVSLTALFRGAALLGSKMDQWEELKVSEILDMAEMPDLDKVSLKNYPLLADLGLQILAVTIRVLNQAEKDLSGISDELSLTIPGVPSSWQPAITEIPSPLTRALAMLEDALDETPQWRSKRTSDMSVAAISEAETLIQAMETTLSLDTSSIGKDNAHESLEDNLCRPLDSASLEEGTQPTKDSKTAKSVTEVKAPPALQKTPQKIPHSNYGKPTLPSSKKNQGGAATQKKK